MDLFILIVVGIVVVAIVIVGFVSPFTDEHTKGESIPKKLAIGAGTSIGGIWAAAIFVISVALLLWFIFNGGLAQPE